VPLAAIKDKFQELQELAQNIRYSRKSYSNHDKNNTAQLSFTTNKKIIDKTAATKTAAGPNMLAVNINKVKTAPASPTAGEA